MDAKRDRSLDGIADEAAEWVVLLGDPQLAEQDRSAFVAWLKRSPVHLREYLRAEQAWADLGGIDAERRIDIDALLARPDANVVELDAAAAVAGSEHGPSRGRAARWARWTRTLAATAACLAVAGLLGVHFRPAEDYATAIGEQRKIQLEDGSSVLLNTDTRLDVDYTSTARHVRLLAGEALFSVQKDAARPFRVLSDRAVVEVVGTSFVVRRKPGQTVVTVLEGEVSVAPMEGGADLSAVRMPAGALRLRAGAQVDVAGNDMRTRDIENPAAVAAWRSGQLIFDGESLAEVVAEFNRYNRVKLVLEDPVLSAEQVSGVFDSDRPQALVGFLEHSAMVEPAVVAGDRILLVPRR